MGMRIIGTGIVSSLLENLHKKTNPQALAALRKGGEQIKNLAGDMAPVDKYNLANAIETSEDRLGSNRRVRINVFVDEQREVPGRPGKKIGDYAIRMHEGIYNLGPNSRAKQAANPAVTVGRKYLERALKELERDIVKSVKDAVRKSL